MEAQAKHLVIVGLGNPGKKYALTRHNLGFLVVQGLAEAYEWTMKEQKRFKASVAKGMQHGMMVHLVLPLTYMNNSGKAVYDYLSYYKLGPGHLFVVCDDCALPFGKERVRVQGSSAGHNGLESIEGYMQTRKYDRLRMGIGPANPQMDLADFVLGRFTLEEMEQLPEFIARGVSILKCLPTENNLSALMTRVNS